MALNQWSGAYRDRLETANFHFDAAIEAIEAQNLVLRNNVVAGTERVAYHLPGQTCDTPTADLWVNNEVGKIACVAFGLSHVDSYRINNE
jgi:hypothetical protein